MRRPRIQSRTKASQRCFSLNNWSGRQLAFSFCTFSVRCCLGGTDESTRLSHVALPSPSWFELLGASDLRQRLWSCLVAVRDAGAIVGYGTRISSLGPTGARAV
uniref:Uncharacterized protein n=1 Tax=Cacopsylla melanoneura TaxID=428564 RepID=A0A8D8V2D1_9HEMI